MPQNSTRPRLAMEEDNTTEQPRPRDNASPVTLNSDQGINNNSPENQDNITVQNEEEAVEQNVMDQANTLDERHKIIETTPEHTSGNSSVNNDTHKSKTEIEKSLSDNISNNNLSIILNESSTTMETLPKHTDEHLHGIEDKEMHENKNGLIVKKLQDVEDKAVVQTVTNRPQSDESPSADSLVLDIAQTEMHM